jgi:hypothetical protein
VTVSNQGSLAGNAGSLSIWLNKAAEAECGETSDRTNTTIGVLNAGQAITLPFSGFTQPASLITNTFRAYINSECTEEESRWITIRRS